MCSKIPFDPEKEKLIRTSVMHRGQFKLRHVKAIKSIPML